MKYILFVAIFFLFSCANIAAQDNPFMQMADKKYTQYSREFINEFYRHIGLKDTVLYRKYVSQIEEVAKKTGSMEWKLQAAYCQLSIVKAYRACGITNFSEEDNLRLTFDLLKKVQKAGVAHVELKLRRDIIESYWYYIKNYELALEQCEIQNQRLQDLSADEIPELTHYYLQIAEVYYSFKDYSKTISYCEKILSYKETISNQWFQLGALNTMGLSYRYGFNDLDCSDSCFQIILQTKEYLNPNEIPRRENWEGIAQGNIGYNMVLRQEYDKAIPLLKSSIEKMLKFGDYAYSAFPAIHLAAAYLKKGNLPEAKRYIDSATHYYAKQPREGAMSFIYETKSMYYAAIGNSNLCIDYIDSTLTENKRLQKQFDAFHLMRIEQHKHLSEQKLKDEQLITEKVRATGYQRTLIVTMVGLLLICGLFARYIVLYRKKKSAYHALVVKTQQWAQTPSVQNTDEKSDEFNQQIFAQVNQLMLDQQIYLNPQSTLDQVALQMGICRTYLSQAVNHCSGDNFSTFINEFRVKEAVHLLSDHKYQHLSMEGIATNAGFNDRKTFHRAFKKATGLSPSEFKKNMENG